MMNEKKYILPWKDLRHIMWLCTCMYVCARVCAAVNYDEATMAQVERIQKEVYMHVRHHRPCGL